MQLFSKNLPYFSIYEALTVRVWKYDNLFGRNT